MNTWHLLLVEHSICDLLTLSVNIHRQSLLENGGTELSYIAHFGSLYTYPLLDPFTSLICSSKPSKSSAVTASNPTSNKMSAHSKNAYVVYAKAVSQEIGAGRLVKVYRPVLCELCVG